MIRLKTILAFFAAISFASSMSAADVLVFFGTYTNALSRGIYVSRFDPATGELSAPELAAETPSPSYLAISPGQKFLYAANEVDGFKDSSTENGGAVTAFALDPTSGQLTFLNQMCSSGSSPCHLSLDRSGRVLLVANYSSGSLKTFPLDAQGTLGEGGELVVHHGHGPNPARQASAHAHFITTDPSNRFALSCDLGTDEVLVHPFDANTAALHSAQVRAFKLLPGSGPRHLAFGPNGKSIHVLNELACTITTLAWDSQAGNLKLIQTISALPPGVAVRPEYTAAEILTCGNCVYATLRGHDSVSVFTAEPATGTLVFLQNIPSGGQQPRGLGIDPTGHWLLAGNQKSDRVAEFKIDQATGRLTATGRTLNIGAPVDVKFMPQP